MIQLEISEEEVLALRWLLGQCGTLSGDLQNNCPFVYHYACKALETMGGNVKLSEGATGLWDHPLAKAFYENYEEAAD